MKKFERLDEATAPDGTVLTLYRHDGAYYIRVDGVELMSTRRHHSEDALAAIVCEPLASFPNPRVLIGGLGLGFTLRAALQMLPATAHVTVAELVPAVIEWNRNPEYELARESLDDPRVDLRLADVDEILAASPAAFDGIMLDVDNGAGALTTAGNARLYTRAGIERASAALRSGGRLAYWSAEPDASFEKALRGAGLTVETKRVRAHDSSGGWYTLFVAQRG
ncbi:MAG TPA: hypothetical protein VGM67_05050 [Gemmatimonadaceae bacterium]|jgi:spermidine synthase